MRSEIGIHPGNDVTLLYVKIAAAKLAVRPDRIERNNRCARLAGRFIRFYFGDVLVMVKNLAAENAVNLHDPGDALYLNPAVLRIDIGPGIDAAALYTLHIFLEGGVAVPLGGDPDLVAVEVAHNRHVRVVGQRILGDEINI